MAHFPLAGALPFFHRLSTWTRKFLEAVSQRFSLHTPMALLLPAFASGFNGNALLRVLGQVLATFLALLATLLVLAVLFKRHPKSKTTRLPAQEPCAGDFPAVSK